MNTKTESLSATTRKVTDNIEILMDGGKLTNDINIYSFLEIALEYGDSNSCDFTLEEFAELTEYTEPKSEREIKLEEEIELLKAKVESLVEINSFVSSGCEPKHIKPRVVYDQESKLKIAQDWKTDRNSEHPMNLKQMAIKYNISTNYLVTILKELGVYSPKKKKQKINTKVV